MTDTNNPPEPATTTVPPVVEPPGPTSSPAPGPTGDGAEPPSPPSTETPPQTTTEPPAQDWRDKRIATLTRRLRELQEKGNAPPATTTEPPTTTAPAPLQPPTNLDALVNQRARELANIQDFNRRCDEAALAGRSAFGESEFNGRIANLQKLVDNTDPSSVKAYNDLLMAALETGEAPRVLFDLGADLNEAQKVLSMTPTKMAVEMTRKAAMPPGTVSNAPKPITPIPSRGAANERISPDDPDRSDHLSTAEWMRRREEQLAARRAANGTGR